MRIEISFIIITDDPKDLAKILSEFESYDFKTNHEMISSLDELKQIITLRNWHFILLKNSDDELSLITFLQFLNDSNLNIPLILIGNNYSNDKIINHIESGVYDYIDCNHLYRVIQIASKLLFNEHLIHQKIISDNKIELLSQIVSHSKEEIYLLNPDTMSFTYGNNTLINNLGYDLDTFLSLNIYDIRFTNKHKSFKSLLKKLLSGEIDNFTIKELRKRKDKSSYPVKTYIELFHGQQKIIIGRSENITEKKNLLSDLNESKYKVGKLTLSNNFKTQFIASISHEMRTTLNSVALIGQILSKNEENNLSNEQLEFIKLIKDSNAGLLDLLNQVLDISKIDSGTMSLRFEEVDIHSLFSRIARLYQPIAREKGISFNFISKLEKNSTFVTDKIRLEQVLKNILSNALKFTFKGSINLSIYENIANNKEFVIEVSDTGIGIPLSKQKQIFESYFQVDDETNTLNRIGTGLGLSISKEIIDNLKGTLTVESKLKVGSTFKITLPLNGNYWNENKKFKTKESLSVNGKSFSKKEKFKYPGKVLIIDDSEIHNMALKKFLEFKIKECQTAESASEAYELLNKETFDCIILDMHLPDAHVYDVLKKLRSDVKTSKTPIIIYTGKNLKASDEIELNLYTKHFIQKNISSNKLLLNTIIEMYETKLV